MRIRYWSSDLCYSDLYANNLSLAAKIWGGDDARDGKREKLVFRADENLHAVARPRAFQKRDEILLAFKLVQKLPDALQIGHRALIQQMSLSAHDQHRPLVAILRPCGKALCDDMLRGAVDRCARSEEHTSELQSLMRISYAVFCLKKKKKK